RDTTGRPGAASSTASIRPPSRATSASTADGSIPHLWPRHRVLARLSPKGTPPHEMSYSPGGVTDPQQDRNEDRLIKAIVGLTSGQVRSASATCGTGRARWAR